MATQFTATVQASSGDYTSLSAAESGLQNDLTAADIKVFSISASSVTTIAPGDSVLGQTSLATGTCVLVNASRTQILIKSIAVSNFISGEVVQKTTDATKTVTLSNAGDSPIIGIACGGIQDVYTIFDGWTTSATNYVRVYAQVGAEAKMPYNTTTSYRIEGFVEDGAASGLLYSREEFFRVERIQAKPTPYPYAHNAFVFGSNVVSTSDVRWTGCLVAGFADAADTGEHKGFYVGSLAAIINCVVYGFSDTYVTTGGFARTDVDHVSFYNCTAYNCCNGFLSAGSGNYAKNCLYDQAAQSTFQGFYGNPFLSGTTNNASTDNTAPSPNARNNQTFTYINAAGGDFHIAGADKGARSFGADLSADASYPFSSDFDGATRTTPWDIGATKFESLIKTVDTLVHDSNKTLNGTPINQVRQRDGLS